MLRENKIDLKDMEWFEYKVYTADCLRPSVHYQGEVNTTPNSFQDDAQNVLSVQLYVCFSSSTICSVNHFILQNSVVTLRVTKQICGLVLLILCENLWSEILIEKGALMSQTLQILV